MTGAGEGLAHVSDGPGNAEALPRGGGTYVLVLRLARACDRPVGRLGTVRLQAGMYCYVGSVLGLGGLRARLQRHARSSKRCHWHVDHLRAVAAVADLQELPMRLAAAARVRPAEIGVWHPPDLAGA